ncbi:hypothetical protein [Paenibacillus tundrae]
MNRQDVYMRIIEDINARLKRISKQYEETGDAEAMHLGIKQIVYGRDFKDRTKEEGA